MMLGLVGEEEETLSDVVAAAGRKSSAAAGGGAVDEQRMGKAEQRVEGGLLSLQWGQRETSELISIRGEADRRERGMAAAAGRRRSSEKAMWEAVALRMWERGHRRTIEQCKCKWKNLVSRYKGKETSDPESRRQCPFFEELHAVFTEPASNAQHLLEFESGAPQTKKRSKRLHGEGTSDELSDDGDNNEEEKERVASSKKANVGARQQNKPKGSNNIYNLVEDFLHQQRHSEIQWLETMDRQAQERCAFEQEWRRSMEKLERERLMAEQVWWERQEQRRIREENRAEERDALVTALLNRYIHEGL